MDQMVNSVPLQWFVAMFRVVQLENLGAQDESSTDPKLRHQDGVDKKRDQRRQK